jgi:hypothetical protein
MNKLKNWHFAILILLFAALACTTGYSTSHTVTGNQGQVVLKTKSADGSNQTGIEIDEDYEWITIPMTITITVDAGSYQATFVDHEENNVTLKALPDNPASIRTEMVTDGFGKIMLQSEANGAEGVIITIDYIVPVY